MACNTSVDQYLVFNIDRTTFKDPKIAGPNPQQGDTPSDISPVMSIWLIASGILLDLFVSPSYPSVFYPVVNNNNLSFLSLTYTGNP